MTKRGCPGKCCCLWNWRELMESGNHEGGEVYQKVSANGDGRVESVGQETCGKVAWQVRKLLRMVRVQLLI